MRYWWIEHTPTVLQDISGDYLWSPKKTTGRAGARYSENMRVAAAGDLILSCAGGCFGHVGRVAGRALAEGRGDGSGEGWWLPVEWMPLKRPRPVGDGERPRAGLAEIPEDRFDAVVREDDLADRADAAFDDAAPEAPGQVADPRPGYDAALAASVRDQLIRARRGQGLFRFRAFQIESVCRLTGIANPHLLIASHIRPWRLCETTHERLDGANGLLLTPHVDRLFDRGLISFSKDGDVLRSPRLSGDDLRRLGLAEACGRNAGAFSERQQVYLEWHRADVFDDGAG